MQQAQATRCASARKLNTKHWIIFVIIAAIWLVLDIITKQMANAYEPGQLIAGPFAGIFEIRLIHNTGGAWGMFGDSTLVLGCVSLLVCAVILAYLFKAGYETGTASFISLAFVFAGGIGNAIDRFTLGYVVDMIEPVFIDFPVFNVADIGVTCGIIGFLICLIITMNKNPETAATDKENS